MASLDLRVADDTDERHAVELSERLSHVALCLVPLFAGVAPSLLVIWVVIVLYDANRRLQRVKHVAAHNG